MDYLVDKLFEMQGVANPRLPQLKAQMADVLKKIENIIQAVEQGTENPRVGGSIPPRGTILT